MRLYEDFIDDIDLTPDSIDDLQHERLPANRKFMLKFITSFCGINYHWREVDPCFYPVESIYKRICHVLDRTGLLIDPRVSLPTARDCNGKNNNDKKMKPFTVTDDMFGDDTIDINALYGWNELSDSTTFTYDITFEGIVPCSFKQFHAKFDRMVEALGKAIKIFPKDRGELQFWVKQENGEYKDATYSRIYTDVSTFPGNMYTKMYNILLPDRTIPEEQSDAEEWMKKERCKVDLDSIVRNALNYMAEHSPLKPQVKLLYTVNAPFGYRVWNSPRPCSFILADLKFPTNEVDLVDIDEMIYTTLPKFFPKRFMSVVTPVFLFRCPNKIVRTDRDEAKEKQDRYRTKDTIYSDRASYKAEETVFKNILDSEGKPLKVECAEYYRGRAQKLDQLIRKAEKIVYVLFDAKGKHGRIPFSEMNAGYPFNGELKQLGCFADDHDIFKGDYNLLDKYWF